MKTKFKAVLKVSIKQPVKLANLIIRVKDKLIENADVYAAPDPSTNELDTEGAKLVSLNGQAKGNTQKKDERDAQAVIVYGLLSDELKYVNDVAKGDKVKVDKSGFDSEKEAESHGIPARVSIKKVDDGPFDHSGKILLARPLAPRLLYSAQIVEITKGQGNNNPPSDSDDDGFDPDKLPWTMALQGVSSKELLLLNLKRGKDIAIRVRTEDGAKKSGWSDPYFFLPR